jgi:hypothetical protein
MVFTRQGIADYLNMPADRIDNIKRKLTKMGYKYTTSGRGKDYLVEIISEPKQTLEWFCQTYFGIRPQNINAFAHFLHFIFTIGLPDELHASWAPGSLSRRTGYSKNTVQKYLHQIILSGAFVITGEDFYYATKNVRTKPEGNFVKQTQLVREITYEEYMRAYTAFFTTYDELMKNIEDNPDMIPSLAKLRANTAKAAALDGWWVHPGRRDKIIPNHRWKHLKQLLSLLEEYPYADYFEYETIDIVAEMEQIFEQHLRFHLCRHDQLPPQPLVDFREH